MVKHLGNPGKQGNGTEPAGGLEKVFILPSNISQNSYIVQLPVDYSTSSTTRSQQFLCCPSAGFYEITRVSPQAKHDYRSWLFAREHSARSTNSSQLGPAADAATVSNAEKTDEHAGRLRVQGHPNRSSSGAEMLIASPIDPLFLVLPMLYGENQKQKGPSREFASLDGHLDSLSTLSPCWSALLGHPDIRARVSSRIEAVCETMEIGDETLHCLSMELLLKQLYDKARSVFKSSLPDSIRSSFVKGALQLPYTPTDENADQVIADPKAENPSREMDVESLNKNLEALTSFRVALDMIFSYINPSLRIILNSSLLKVTGLDFTLLINHQIEASKLKETLALRTLSDNMSRKRSAPEDDEAAQIREEKKRLKEMEERKLKAQSRGIKELRKVDISGMKKMSSFFFKSSKKGD